jgi:hypothetical protein
MSIGKMMFSFIDGVLIKNSVMIRGIDIEMGNWTEGQQGRKGQGKCESAKATA